MAQPIYRFKQNHCSPHAVCRECCVSSWSRISWHRTDNLWRAASRCTSRDGSYFSTCAKQPSSETISCHANAPHAALVVASYLGRGADDRRLHYHGRWHGATPQHHTPMVRDWDPNTEGAWRCVRPSQVLEGMWSLQHTGYNFLNMLGKLDVILII